jgi:DNA-binding response OmpR family regulator
MMGTSSPLRPAPDGGANPTRSRRAVLLLTDGTAPTGRGLEACGWTVSAVGDVERARWLASVRTYQAIVISGRSQVWTARSLSALREASPAPILVTGCGDDTRDRTLFDLGADMVADRRADDVWVSSALTALVRRSGSTDPVLRYLESPGLVVDLRSRSVTMGDRRITLAPIEFGLLELLMTHAQVALRHQTIINAVWNWKYGDNRNALRIQVNRLRKKLDDVADEPRFIRSLHGYGYSFVQPVSQLADGFTPVGNRSDSERLPAFTSELRRLGQAMRGLPDIDAAAQFLVDRVVEQSMCHGAAVLERDRPGRTLHLLAQSGMSDEWLDSVRDGIPMESRFISADTVLTGQALHVVDMTAPPHRWPASARLLKAAELPMFLSIPLANRSGVWGHLGYTARADRAFTPAHVMLLEGAGLLLGALAREEPGEPGSRIPPPLRRVRIG